LHDPHLGSGTKEREPKAGAILRKLGGIPKHPEAVFAQVKCSPGHSGARPGSQPTSLIRKRSQVQILYRPPGHDHNQKELARPTRPSGSHSVSVLGRSRPWRHAVAGARTPSTATTRRPAATRTSTSGAPAAGAAPSRLGTARTAGEFAARCAARQRPRFATSSGFCTPTSRRPSASVKAMTVQQAAEDWPLR
jgi:hypothetical protein